MSGRFVAIVMGFSLLAGCGGGSGPAAPPAVTSIGSSTSAVIGSGVIGKLLLTVASGVASTSAAHRTVKFVSPGALSAGISINGGTTVFADVSSSSTLCTTTAGVRTCTISVGAPAGQSAFGVSLYDAANGGGHLLGSGSNSTMVVAGTAFTVAVGVNPVVASLANPGNATNFKAGVSGSVTVTPTFADAAGQPITGSGNVPNFLFPVTITLNNAHITVTPSTLISPGQSVTFVYDGSGAVPSSVTSTLTSNGVTIFNGVVPVLGLAISRRSIGAIAAAFPYQLIVGPDGHLWWAEDNDNSVGSINPAPGNTPVRFATGFATGHPIGIAAGGDGNIWVNNGATLIQRLSTAGAAVGAQINVGSGAFLDHMAADGAGNIWYLDIGNSKVGEIDFGTQVVSAFSTLSPNALASLGSIALGPDGAMYFTERGSVKRIGRVTTAATRVADGQPLGTITEYPIPNTSNTIFPTGIAKGPDGNLWFCVFDNPTGANQFFAKFAPVTPPATIAITEYPNVINPNAFANLVTMAAGPDGNMWIVQGGGAVKIPPANPTAAVTQFFTDNGQIDTYGLVAGPDGNMWFTGLGSTGGNGFIPTTDSVNSFTPR